MSVVKKLVVLVILWGGCESVKSKQIGGDDREEHQNVDC